MSKPRKVKKPSLKEQVKAFFGINGEKAQPLGGGRYVMTESGEVVTRGEYEKQRAGRKPTE